MKKIIALLFSFGIFTASFAQYNHGRYDKNDQYVYNNGHGNNGYNDTRDISGRDQNFQLEKINRDFDFRIQDIQNNRYMRRREKREAIKSLQVERSRQIQFLNARYNSRSDKPYERRNDWNNDWR